MTGAVVTISATDIAVPSHPPVTEKTLSKVNAEMARPDEGFLISAIDSTVVMDQVKCTLDCDCPFVVSSIFATGPATRVRVSRTILQGQHSTIHTAASASVNLFQSQVSSVTGCIDAIGSSQIVANQCAFTSEGDTPSGIACLLIRAVGSARVRMEGCTAHFMSAMPSLVGVGMDGHLSRMQLLPASLLLTMPTWLFVPLCAPLPLCPCAYRLTCSLVLFWAMASALAPCLLLTVGSDAGARIDSSPTCSIAHRFQHLTCAQCGTASCHDNGGNHPGDADDLTTDKK